MARQVDELLLKAHELTHGPRRAEYSNPYDDYVRVVDIFEAISGKKLSPEEGALFMLSVKLSRINFNNTHGRLHLDSVIDAAGYLWCYASICEKMDKDTI